MLSRSELYARRTADRERRESDAIAEGFEKYLEEEEDGSGGYCIKILVQLTARSSTSKPDPSYKVVVFVPMCITLNDFRRHIKMAVEKAVETGRIEEESLELEEQSDDDSDMSGGFDNSKLKSFSVSHVALHGTKHASTEPIDDSAALGVILRNRARDLATLEVKNMRAGGKKELPPIVFSATCFGIYMSCD